MRKWTSLYSYTKHNFIDSVLLSCFINEIVIIREYDGFERRFRFIINIFFFFCYQVINKNIMRE